jgi:hypothetical protein
MDTNITYGDWKGMKTYEYESIMSNLESQRGSALDLYDERVCIEQVS